MDTTRAAAIAVAFDLPEPVGPPEFVARGSMGRLWRLRTADGRSWAVKVLFDWGHPDPSGRDVELQEAAAVAGISLPRACRAPDGRVVVDGVRVYEWVDLLPRPSPPDAASLDEAGRVLGALHALALRPHPGEAELAMTVAAWCASTGDVEVLLAGYGAGGGTASIAGPASFASNAATRLNYLRVMADQSLEDDEHRGFADAAVERLLRVEMDAAVPRGWWS